MMTEHEAWTYLAKELSNASGDSHILPAPEFCTEDPSWGLCHFISDLESFRQIDNDTNIKMMARLSGNAPEPTFYSQSGDGWQCYRWKVGDWESRAKFCKDMAKLTKPQRSAKHVTAKKNGSRKQVRRNRTTGVCAVQRTSPCKRRRKAKVAR